MRILEREARAAAEAMRPPSPASGRAETREAPRAKAGAAEAEIARLPKPRGRGEPNVAVAYIGVCASSATKTAPWRSLPVAT